ncbi:MAG: glycosyltransferase family 9 protein [Actinomycetes bacterium]
MGGAVRAVAAGADSVTMLVGGGRTPVARLLPGVDEVLEFAAGWVDFDPPPISPAAVEAFVAVLRRGAYDRALVFTSYHQSPLPLALLLRMAGVGWVGAVSEDYPGSLLDLRHRVPGSLHEAERALSLAEAAGYPADPDGARLAVRHPLPDVTAHTGLGPYVVVHPGAAVPARRPSPQTTRRIVRALAEAGHRVLVTGAAGESALAQAAAADQARDLSGRLDLPQLAGVLAGATAVVAPNTGPAHLAAAVGTPVVSLFAPVVDSANWAPYGVPRVELGDQAAPCRGTRARLCPVPGHPCLDDIEETEVVAAVESLARRPVLTGDPL